MGERRLPLGRLERELERVPRQDRRRLLALQKLDALALLHLLEARHPELVDGAGLFDITGHLGQSLY